MRQDNEQTALDQHVGSNKEQAAEGRLVRVTEDSHNPQPPALVHPNGEHSSPALQRLRPGLTMGELNRLTNIPRTTLVRMLNHQRRLTVAQAVKIAIALNVPVDRVIEALA